MKGREKKQRRLWRYVIFITERFGQSSDPWKRKSGCMVDRERFPWCWSCTCRKKSRKKMVLAGNIDEGNLRASVITRIWCSALEGLYQDQFPLLPRDVRSSPVCIHFGLWETQDFLNHVVTKARFVSKPHGKSLKEETGMSQTWRRTPYTSEAASVLQRARQLQCVLKVLSQKWIHRWCHSLHNAY